MAGYEIAHRARIDLKGIYRYIAEDNRQAARKLQATFLARFSMLGRQPHIGEPRDELLSGLRSFPVGNYVIFYFPSDDRVRIARVLHGARDIESLF